MVASKLLRMLVVYPAPAPDPLSCVAGPRVRVEWRGHRRVVRRVTDATDLRGVALDFTHPRLLAEAAVEEEYRAGGVLVREG